MSAHFGISWIYEEFHAVRMSHGKCAKEWRAPKPVTNLHEFAAALNAACRVLDMRRGGDVAIAYESDEHAHIFLDLPPMSERDMEKYLNRRIEQEKSFDEPPAWGYRYHSGSGQGKSVLLHVMPANVRDAIMRICEENYIVPRRLLPLTDVMALHVLRDGRQHDENALLVALFDSRIEMVVINAAGDPLFVRELGFHWNAGEMERLRTDIERTLLFARQRLSSTIGFVSLMGVDAVEAAEHLQRHFDITLQPDEQSLESSFWAAEVNRLPKRTRTNFIPRSMQRAITSRQLVNTSKRMAVTASLVAIAVMVSVEYFVFQFSATDHLIVDRIEDLESEHAGLVIQRDELEELQAQLAVLQPSEHALPLVFMQRLGAVLPASMVLNRVDVQRSDAGWSFQLLGANQPTLTDTAVNLQVLAARLGDAPWYATVSDSWQEEWLEQLRNGQAVSDGAIRFQMEGELQ